MRHERERSHGSTQEAKLSWQVACNATLQEAWMQCAHRVVEPSPLPAVALPPQRRLAAWKSDGAHSEQRRSSSFSVALALAAVGHSVLACFGVGFTQYMCADVFAGDCGVMWMPGFQEHVRVRYPSHLGSCTVLEGSCKPHGKSISTVLPNGPDLHI